MIQYNPTINGIRVQARYSRENIDGIFLPLLRGLTAMQREKGRRVLVMMAAPPGAGKSTLASFLQTLSLEQPDLAPVTVIGMDGFHRYQDDLTSHTTVRDGIQIPLVQIKGAPITFDLALLTERIRRVAAGEECGWPSYDRLLHNPVENAITVKGDLVLLEGNYLLLDRDGWRDLSAYADYTIRITADESMLRSRLIQRKISSGTEPEAAARFVDFSDMANVRECLRYTKNADLTLVTDAEGGYLVAASGMG